VREKRAIEQAYTIGELVGLPVWCEDEAGPFQAIPQPGESWRPEGTPEKDPHEYFRGGTAKMLTLFCPKDGELRSSAVGRTTNSALHPWLMGELEDILSGLTEPEDMLLRDWSNWRWSDERIHEYTLSPAPYVRMLLVLDNLTGHYSRSFVGWCLEHGVALLYTPLAGSWLNMAESVQRIIVRRAISGQHYRCAGELMDALEAATRGWNACPTPFVWGGKRQERRLRTRQRRHALGGSAAYTRKPLTARGNCTLSAAAQYGKKHCN
jgi:hypothetical protein